MRKAVWLNKKVNLVKTYHVKSLLRNAAVNTVCEVSLCPNLSECFGKGVVTFMILGKICTRSCAFCAVDKAVPLPVDPGEPVRISAMLTQLNLSHVVITSPTRDDLPDGGADIFCQTVERIRAVRPEIKIELLIPDFCGNENILEKIAVSGADIIGHNLETVPRLYPKVRQAACYQQSLNVLKMVKTFNPKLYTKSGLMLGLGEREEEVRSCLLALREQECDFLTLGQYLAPSVKHFPVNQFIPPAKFLFWQEEAAKLGFRGVKSAPYVRSSYRADTFLPTAK